MGIFNSNTKPEPTVDTTVDPRLPVGYDDPESPMFIQEEVREAFTQTERPPREQVDERVQWFGRREAVDAARAAFDAGPARDARGITRVFDTTSPGATEQFAAATRVILQERGREFEALAEHQLRLEDAEIAVALADSEADQRAATAHWSRCTACGASDGTVTAIAKDPGAQLDAYGFYAAGFLPMCATCTTTLRAEQVARAQARTDDAARARIAAVLNGWEG